MTKQCKGCNEPLEFDLKPNGIRVYNQSKGFGKKCGCFRKWLISDDPKAKETFEKFLIKNKSEFNQSIKVKNKEKKIALKEKVKTLSDWKADLQKEINHIIRLIDNGWGCIATKSKEGKMNAGHYIGIGANETLRFHLENIWLQSEHSNSWKSDDTLRYQEGIIRLFGKDYLEYLNSLKSIEPIRIKPNEIKEKISICRGIIKWLKLQDRNFMLIERLELRKRFNQEIGIYESNN